MISYFLCLDIGSTFAEYILISEFKFLKKNKNYVHLNNIYDLFIKKKLTFFHPH